MINHIKENEYVKYWIEKDILYAIYKNGISLDESAAIKNVKDRHSLQQGRPFLFFYDSRGIKSIRNYLVTEGIALIKAAAFLVNINSLLNYFALTNFSLKPIVLQSWLKYLPKRRLL